MYLLLWSAAIQTLPSKWELFAVGHAQTDKQPLETV